jgi:hypothetical protein
VLILFPFSSKRPRAASCCRPSVDATSWLWFGGKRWFVHPAMQRLQFCALRCTNCVRPCSCPARLFPAFPQFPGDPFDCGGGVTMTPCEPAGGTFGRTCILPFNPRVIYHASSCTGKQPQILEFFAREIFCFSNRLVTQARREDVCALRTMQWTS